MLPASDQPSSFSDPGRDRRRAIGFLLALAIHVLLLFVLLRIAPEVQRAVSKRSWNTFRILPEARNEATGTKAEVKKERAAGGPPKRAPAKPKVSPVTVPPPNPKPLNMLVLTRRQFAASDISKLQAPPNEQTAEGQTGPATGTQRGAQVSADGSPGGGELHDVQWYREPTNAELSYYLPPNPPRTGWALIACQTAARYRVDNCRELADSPPGSRLAGAIRQAAWQFMVIPPRINGQPILGAWVRIRIDFTESGARASR
jgi:protein TonB